MANKNASSSKLGKRKANEAFSNDDSSGLAKKSRGRPPKDQSAADTKRKASAILRQDDSAGHTKRRRGRPRKDQQHTSSATPFPSRTRRNWDRRPGERHSRRLNNEPVEYGLMPEDVIRKPRQNRAPAAISQGTSTGAVMQNQSASSQPQSVLLTIPAQLPIVSVAPLAATASPVVAATVPTLSSTAAAPTDQHLLSAREAAESSDSDSDSENDEQDVPEGLAGPAPRTTPATNPQSAVPTPPSAAGNAMLQTSISRCHATGTSIAEVQHVAPGVEHTCRNYPEFSKGISVCEVTSTTTPCNDPVILHVFDGCDCPFRNGGIADTEGGDRDGGQGTDKDVSKWQWRGQ